MNRETEPKPTEKPFVRFIFLRHHQFPEDPTPLLDLLSDVNVLFVEAVSLYETPEKRAGGEKSLQLCLANPRTLDAQVQREQDETIAKLAQRPNFVNDLIVRLAKSGKQLFYVDLDTQHPAHHYIEIVSTETLKLQTFVQQGHIAEARALLPTVCAHGAELYRVREETVAKQITTITQSLQKLGSPVRAAVIQGIVHTQTATLLDADNFTVESHEEDIPLPLMYQIIKKLRLGEAVEEYEYNQLLLIHPIFLQITHPKEFDLHLATITDLVCSLNKEQVASLLSQFELFYRQAQKRLIKTTGRLSEEMIRVHAPALFYEAAHKTLEVAKYWAGK